MAFVKRIAGATASYRRSRKTMGASFCGAVAFVGALAICSSASATIVQAEFSGNTTEALIRSTITLVPITAVSSGCPSSWTISSTPQYRTTSFVPQL
jgi:hypothetical protein